VVRVNSVDRVGTSRVNRVRASRVRVTDRVSFSVSANYSGSGFVQEKCWFMHKNWLWETITYIQIWKHPWHWQLLFHQCVVIIRDVLSWRAASLSWPTMGYKSKYQNQILNRVPTDLETVCAFSFVLKVRKLIWSGKVREFCWWSGKMICIMIIRVLWFAFIFVEKIKIHI